MMFRGLTVAVVWLVAVAGAAARDVYVDNVQGDDSRDGTLPSVSGEIGGPYRTIARALRSAQGGDRLLLANHGQPYRESITLQAARHSGIAGRPFTMRGNGAVLDGSVPVPKDAWKHHADDVYRFQPPLTSYQLLYLDGKPARRRPAQGGEGPAKLERLEWCLYDRAVYFRVEPGKLPSGYNLAYTALPVGVTLYEVRHVLISDLVVQGFQLDGVNAHDGVFDAELLGLTCRGNGRSGISVGGASRVRIAGCLVGDNGAAQVRTEGFSRTEIANCKLLENTAPGLVREGGLVTMLRFGEKP